MSGSRTACLCVGQIRKIGIPASLSLLLMKLRWNDYQPDSQKMTEGRLECDVLGESSGS